jgi:hypothetical protein
MRARYNSGPNLPFRHVARPALQGKPKIRLLEVVDYPKSISIYKEGIYENLVCTANHRDVCPDRSCG